MLSTNTTGMAERLTILFDKHLRGSLTADEHVELMGLFLEPALQPQLQILVGAAWNKTGEEEDMPEETRQTLFQGILGNANLKKENEEAAGEARQVQVIQIEPVSQTRIGWKRWIVAASIAGLLGVGSYLTFFNNKEPKPETPVALAPTDVQAPTSSKAMITLANGQRVYLDSVANGELAMQGNVRLVKSGDGRITYETAATVVTTEVQYNTLSNPRGSKVIDMTLADGSRVWLNAGSSVTYPITFTERERKVTMTGEAYFEIMHDPSRPFKVSKGQMEVEVLGTHFNVNAYDDEPTLKVTLFEGSVKVKNGSNSKVIKPGQQVDNNLKIYNDVDLEEVMAWKNGLFSMHKAGIGTIMRQLARWYDVDVEYENGIPKGTISGDVPRNLSLAEVLKVYEYSGVHFVINEKTIVVKP